MARKIRNMASGAVTMEYQNNWVIYNAIELDDVCLGIRKHTIECFDGSVKTFYGFPVTKKENGKTREAGDKNPPKKYMQYREQLIAMIEGAN